MASEAVSTFSYERFAVFIGVVVRFLFKRPANPTSGGIAEH